MGPKVRWHLPRNVIDTAKIWIDYAPGMESRGPAAVSRPASRPNLDSLGLGLGCLCLGLGGPSQGWRSRSPASVSRPAWRPSFDGLNLGLGLGCPCFGLGLGGPGLDYNPAMHIYNRYWLKLYSSIFFSLKHLRCHDIFLAHYEITMIIVFVCHDNQVIVVRSLSVHQLGNICM